jgi:hypothetical protein
VIECKIERSDPILSMETYLTRKGLFSEELKIDAVAGFKTNLEAAIALLPHDDAYFLHST